MSSGYMRGCAGKKRHEEKRGAVAVRASLARTHKIPVSSMSVYRCIQCLGWHVGHNTGVFISRTRTGKRPNKRMRGRI